MVDKAKPGADFPEWLVKLIRDIEARDQTSFGDVSFNLACEVGMAVWFRDRLPKDLPPSA